MAWYRVGSLLGIEQESLQTKEITWFDLIIRADYDFTCQYEINFLQMDICTPKPRLLNTRSLDRMEFLNLVLKIFSINLDFQAKMSNCTPQSKFLA